MLGAAHDRIPVYSSAGLWLSATPDELATEAAGYVAEGFGGVKMRVGKAHVEEDVERVAAVRKAIGPKVSLMCDASRGFTADHAIRLGRKLEAFDLTWFEEPVPPYDHRGSARVAAALDTPIASGETEATRYGFREMLAHGAADIWMADLGRVGGVSEFVKVAHLAAAHDIAISNHLFTAAEHRPARRLRQRDLARIHAVDIEALSRAHRGRGRLHRRARPSGPRLHLRSGCDRALSGALRARARVTSVRP